MKNHQEQRVHVPAGPGVPAPGVVRLAPVAGETTLSFLDRLADRYHLEVRDLAPALVTRGGQSELFKGYRPDGEVYLNAAARARLAAFCRVPQEHLRRALPAWAQEEPVSREGSGPAGRFSFGRVLAPAGNGCPRCVAARTGRAKAARVYLAPQERVCRRHGYWLLGSHWVAGALVGVEHVDVSGQPAIVAASRRHRNLLRGMQGGTEVAEAFVLAQAIVTSWWAQQWGREEVWPQRVGEMSPVGADEQWWRLLLREAVTYPEAVAVAEVLSSVRLQHRVRVATAGHRPHSLADAPDLLAALAGQTGRPWLPGEIAGVSTGPLFTWLRACSRPQDTAGEAGMWRLRLAHSPRPIARELQEYQDAVHGAGGEPAAARRHLGLRQRPDHAFATGLEHARAYAAGAGHLSTPKGTRVNGFPLGQWLSNQRNYEAMPPEWAALLEAIDPWWKTPWTVMWQRTYYQARDHARKAGTAGLAAEQGFPATPLALGEWLYIQCTQYTELHPQQQRLLADIGITREAAGAARPRRKNIKAHFECALDHARAFAAEHGSLAFAGAGTYRDGFPLGQWLANQRSKASRRSVPSPRARALSAIDAWWNPPWKPAWQRNWYRVGAQTAAGLVLDPSEAFPGVDDELAAWLHDQCTAHEHLHPDQHHLLAGIGITAATARMSVPRPNAAAPAAPAAPEDVARLAGVDFAVGLAHARAYAHIHGHLTIDRATRQDGFPLGYWLARQRSAARAHQAQHGRPSPEAQALAAIAPWWCPPWRLTWQQSWQDAHDHLCSGHRLDPADSFASTAPVLRAWLGKQCTEYWRLRPEQERLMADLGITAQAARTWRRAARPARTPQPLQPGSEQALAHARAYFAVHGHLVPATDTVHDGFVLGVWLKDQRGRAVTTVSPIHQQLDTIDPWWNPPWLIAWQQTWHRTRTLHIASQALPAGLRAWARAQAGAWDQLHTQQQALLTRIDITPADARPRRRTTRPYPTGPGIAHARDHAQAVGHLTPTTDTVHDGFPLGRWLGQQRAKARHGRLSPATTQALNAIDPWWNPPWPYTWQTLYHRARTAQAGDTGLPTNLQRWATQQQHRWHHLHPHQQALLTTISITPEAVTSGEVLAEA